MVSGRLLSSLPYAVSHACGSSRRSPAFHALRRWQVRLLFLTLLRHGALLMFMKHMQSSAPVWVGPKLDFPEEGFVQDDRGGGCTSPSPPLIELDPPIDALSTTSTSSSKSKTAPALLSGSISAPPPVPIGPLTRTSKLLARLYTYSQVAKITEDMWLRSCRDIHQLAALHEATEARSSLAHSVSVPPAAEETSVSAKIMSKGLSFFLRTVDRAKEDEVAAAFFVSHPTLICLVDMAEIRKLALRLLCGRPLQRVALQALGTFLPVIEPPLMSASLLRVGPEIAARLVQADSRAERVLWIHSFLSFVGAVVEGQSRSTIDTKRELFLSLVSALLVDAEAASAASILKSNRRDVLGRAEAPQILADFLESDDELRKDERAWAALDLLSTALLDAPGICRSFSGLVACSNGDQSAVSTEFIERTSVLLARSAASGPSIEPIMGLLVESYRMSKSIRMPRENALGLILLHLANENLPPHAIAHFLAAASSALGRKTLYSAFYFILEVHQRRLRDAYIPPSLHLRLLSPLLRLADPSDPVPYALVDRLINSYGSRMALVHDRRDAGTVSRPSAERARQEAIRATGSIRAFARVHSSRLNRPELQTSLMHLLARCEDYDAVDVIWKRLRKAQEKGALSNRAVSIYFDACGHGEATERAIASFSRLQATGYALDLNSYHSILECFARLDQWTRVRSLLQSMSTDRLPGTPAKPSPLPSPSSPSTEPPATSVQATAATLRLVLSQAGARQRVWARKGPIELPAAGLKMTAEQKERARMLRIKEDVVEFLEKTFPGLAEKAIASQEADTGTRLDQGRRLQG